MSVQINGTTGVTTPALVLTGSASGTLTVVAPAVTGTTTITFPATSGTALLQAPSGALTLTNGSGGNLILQPAAGAGTTTITFPATAGSAGQFLSTDGSGNTSWTAAGSGGTPGGATTQVQYNNAGAFGGAAGFTFDGTSQVTLGVASTTSGALRLFSSAGANGVTVVSGNNAAAWTLTLPTSGGTNGQVLTTNGSGVTSWGSPAAGSATGGTFDIGTGSSTTGTLNLYNAGTPNALGIKSGVNTAPWTLTLPIGPGTNGQVLTTDGTGTTSWQSPSAASAAGGAFGIGTAGSTTGSLNMYNAGSANGVSIQSGANTSNWTLTLPTGPGTAGYFMTTDGAGVTSWTQGSITLGTTAINLGDTVTALNGLTSVTVTTDPTSALQLATKQYVDANVDPLNRISPCKYAAITNVAPTGNATIDGSAVVTGDRVLLIGNTLPAENGIWEVNTGGAWARPTDADLWTEVVAATVFITSGATQANTSWIQLTPAPGTMGLTPQNWVQQGGLNSYTAGLGTSIAVGNIINNTGVVVLSGGTTGLTNTFTALTGTATLGGTLAIANGGTGQTTASAALDALLPAQGPNAGKTLTTDGTTATWQTPSAGSASGGTFGIGTGGSVTGSLNLYSSANTNGVTIRSGTNAAAWTLTLPGSPGTSGQVLQTDGTGATVWSTLVQAGVAGQLAWYPSSGSSVDGNINVTATAGALTLGVLNTTAGSLVLNGGTSGAVTINVAAAAGTWALTLPVNDGGAGQVLTTDGNGVTSWTTPSSGTASGGAFAIGTASSQTGTLNLFNGSSANGLAIQSGNNTVAWTLTLPTGPGTAGQFLQTDGTGVTTWAAPTTTLTVNTTVISGGTDGRILFNNTNTVGEKAVTGTGNVVLANSPVIVQGEVTGLIETQTSPVITAGALALNCAVGNVFAIALNANITSITFSNVPASGKSISLILSFTADGTARTITWPASVRWPGGTAPTPTSTNAKVDTYVLYTYDGGSNWFGFVSGQDA